METKQELEYQLTRIKGYIKNCEFDLKGLFRDNNMIKNKLERLEEQKIEIERQLETIEDEDE